MERPLHSVTEKVIVSPSSHAFGGLLASRSDVPSRKVAGPHVDHFALVAQLPKGLPRLVPGAVAVYVVHLVKVDVIGLEPLQTSFAVLADLVRRKAAAVCVGFCQVGLALDRIEDLRGPAAAPLANERPKILGVAFFLPPTLNVDVREEVVPGAEGGDMIFKVLSGSCASRSYGAKADVAHQHPVLA